MNQVEGLAHTMYFLEAHINQQKRCDWDEQSESTKAEWRGYAEGVIRLSVEGK